SDQAAILEMLDRLQKAARTEGEQPAGAKLRDFISREVDSAAAHRIVSEGEIAVAEVVEHVDDSILIGAAGVGEESGGKKVQKAVHARASGGGGVGDGDM